MVVQKLKGIVNKNKNRNLRVVKVKENRLCKYCNNVIHTDTECLTVNKKLQPRYWVCGDCVDKITNYSEAKATLNDVAFGDEGGYMANQDYLAKCESECESIGYFDDSNLNDYFN